MSTTLPPKATKSRKKAIVVFVIVAAVVLGLCGWWLYGVTRVYPLGSKLEYVGKYDFGCYLLCDSNPTSTYYYATDMTIKEITTYFNSTLERQPSIIGDKTYFGIKTPSGETIYTYYYSSKDKVTKHYSLGTSTKNHVLEIPSFKYDLVKHSL